MAVTENIRRKMVACRALMDSSVDGERRAAKRTYDRLVKLYGAEGEDPEIKQAKPKDWTSYRNKPRPGHGQAIILHNDPELLSAALETSIWLWNSGYFVTPSTIAGDYTVTTDIDINTTIANCYGHHELIEFAIEKGMGLEAIPEIAGRIDDGKIRIDPPKYKNDNNWKSGERSERGN